MLRSKPALAIGLAALLPLITTGITTWTATLESVAGSGISGTALVEAPNGNPSMSTSDSTGRFDSMPVFQSDSARALNRTQTSSRGVPMATRASISISGAQPGEYPWQIVPGRCGLASQPSGAGGQLPPIRVSAEGKGTAQGSVAMALGAGAEYSVVVLQSRTNNSVVACGVLQNGGGLTL
ncbi:MAG TPA: hypothetical protein VFU03_11430 [Gemmatimonadales bacterium]|nr:hypothetical protein [Gemmatimonadales bacterium]